MNERVLATEDVRKAAADMRRKTGELHSEVQTVLALGDRLANPNVWDGPAAVTFRQVQWRRTRSALLPAVDSLERLRSSAEGVIDNILKAGGELAAGPGAALTAVVKVPHPPGPDQLAQRQALWAGLSEAERLQYLRSDAADYAYL